MVADAPLPGKALVILEPQLCLATKVIPCEDGHAQERALLEEVLPNVEPADLWIGDRNFCTFGFMFEIHDSSGKFLLRQHGNVIGTLLDTRKFKGHTDTGSVYKQLLRLTCSLTDRTLVVRRITVELYQPTRNGETIIYLLTNVPLPRCHVDASR